MLTGGARRRMLLDAGQGKECPVLVGMLRPCHLLPSDSGSRASAAPVPHSCCLAMVLPPHAGLLHRKKVPPYLDQSLVPGKVHQNGRKNRKLFPTSAPGMCQPQGLSSYNLVYNSGCSVGAPQRPQVPRALQAYSPLSFQCTHFSWLLWYQLQG